MLDYKDVYNKVYSEKDDYGDIKHSRPDLKEKVILDFIDNKDGTVLDIGSGSGYYLSSLINHGIRAFGIEVSDICCEKYLTSLPHKCIDIVKYSKLKTTHKNDYAVCNDFIEHISINDLDSVLKSIVKLSDNCLFGIANHNEFLCGLQIHQIVQGVDFWIEKLNEYYKNVELVSILMDSRFFFVKCSNKKDDISETNEGYYDAIKSTNTDETNNLSGELIK